MLIPVQPEEPSDSEKSFESFFGGAFLTATFFGAALATDFLTGLKAVIVSEIREFRSERV